MRLLKWMVYGIIGYFVYELVVGMQQGIESPRQRQGGGSGRGRRGGQNITGKGKGKRVAVSGAGGTLEHETVGRGVVR